MYRFWLLALTKGLNCIGAVSCSKSAIAEQRDSANFPSSWSWHQQQGIFGQGSLCIRVSISIIRSRCANQYLFPMRPCSQLCQPHQSGGMVLNTCWISQCLDLPWLLAKSRLIIGLLPNPALSDTTWPTSILSNLSCFAVTWAFHYLPVLTVIPALATLGFLKISPLRPCAFELWPWTPPWLHWMGVWVCFSSIQTSAVSVWGIDQSFVKALYQQLFLPNTLYQIIREHQNQPTVVSKWRAH